MPAAFESVAVDLFTRVEQVAQPVCQLQFSAGAELRALQSLKYLRRENIPADDRKIGRRFCRLRFLHQIFYGVETPVNLPLTFSASSTP